MRLAIGSSIAGHLILVGAVSIGLTSGASPLQPQPPVVSLEIANLGELTAGPGEGDPGVQKNPEKAEASQESEVAQESSRAGGQSDPDPAPDPPPAEEASADPPIPSIPPEKPPAPEETAASEEVSPVSDVGAEAPEVPSLPRPRPERRSSAMTSPAAEKTLAAESTQTAEADRRKPVPASAPRRRPATPEKTEGNLDRMIEDLIAEGHEELTGEAEQSRRTEAPAARSETAASGGSEEMTLSEVDALRDQMAGCWAVLNGAADARSLVVALDIQVNEDRTVKAVTVTDMGRYRSDTFYRSAADAAVRAVWRCSPLRLPEGKHEQWQSIRFKFDPRYLG